MRVASLPIAMLMNVWGLAFFHYFPSRFEVTIAIVSRGRMYAGDNAVAQLKNATVTSCTLQLMHFFG
jgi:hypothetical protein